MFHTRYQKKTGIDKMDVGAYFPYTQELGSMYHAASGNKSTRNPHTKSKEEKSNKVLQSLKDKLLKNFPDFDNP